VSTVSQMPQEVKGGMDKPAVFSPDEIQRFRTELAARRAPGAYEPGRWSVSSYNRDPHVVGQFPSSIAFRDATLRGIETLPGVIVTAADKAEYLRRLVRAGIAQVVTTGIQGRSDDELRAEVELIKTENSACTVVCPLMFSRQDIDRVADAGYDAVQVWVQGFGETSLIYQRIYDAAWRGEEWRTDQTPRNRQEVLARATPLVEHARSRGLAVATPMLMVSYLSVDLLQESVETLAGAGATELTLFDGPGGMSPEAYGYLVAKTKDISPDVQVGLHPHNTFGLGVACAVAAAKAGADVIELSVNGYCGGPGNADLAATATAFEVLYGVATGMRLEDLTSLARAGEALTGYTTAWNHPITGRSAFSWGGMDIITQETTVDPLLHNCVEPAVVGNQRVVPFTPDSGPYTLATKLEALGIDASPEQVVQILAAARERMTESGRLLDNADIEKIARALAAPT